MHLGAIQQGNVLQRFGHMASFQFKLIGIVDELPFAAAAEAEALAHLHGQLVDPEEFHKGIKEIMATSEIITHHIELKDARTIKSTVKPIEKNGELSGRIIFLEDLSTNELKDMILSRHQISGYGIHYLPTEKILQIRQISKTFR